MLNVLYGMGMIVVILLMFTLMVVSHEWGHYITAKKSGVLVHEFAIGMGPAIWTKKKGETLYSIRILPIGGYCKMEGEEGESQNARAMSSRKPWQKFIIVSAGAFMNFVLAWLLLSIYIGYIGVSTNTINKVEPGSPAMEAGLLSGDQIVAVNGKKIKTLVDLSHELSTEPQSYELTIKRGNETKQIAVSTRLLGDEKVPRFGFSVQKDHFNILYNIKAGFSSMIGLIVMVWQSLVDLVSGAIGMDQMAGIVGVVDMGGKVWDSGMAVGGISGAIMNMIYMTALLSANLGVVNLLPLPALDGGRLLFIFIEMIRGKAVSAEKEGLVHFVGMILLMLLTVVVMYNDIVRLMK